MSRQSGGKYRIAYSLPVLPDPDKPDTSLLLQIMIASGLQARGHKVTYVAPVNWEDSVSSDDLRQLSTLPRGWSKSPPFRLARKITWSAQKSLHIPYLNVFSNYAMLDACLRFLPGHDIVQERNGLYRAGVAMACRRLRLPYVLFHDADDILEHDLLGLPLQGVLRSRAKSIIQYNLRTADRIICVSNIARQRLIDTWDVTEERIHVFSNGVDVNIHRPAPEQRAATRARLGMADSLLFIFVGSFFPWQDVTGMLSAFAAILQEFPAARLLLVGDGEQRAGMEAYAGQLGIANSVLFTGFLPQAGVAELVSAADVAVAPYNPMRIDHFAGSSMKIFEYMASGAAIIATAIGQITEVIRDGENGLLVQPGSVEALSAAMRRFAGDLDMRERAGRQARLDAVALYSWEQYLSRLERLYESVLENRLKEKTATTPQWRRNAT